MTSLLETEGEVEQVRLATGIYSSASMMNHSCVPAIINSFSGTRLVVRRQGEEEEAGVTNSVARCALSGLSPLAAR